MKYWALVLSLMCSTLIHAESTSLSKTISEFSNKVESKYGLSYISSLQWGKGKVQSVSLYYSSKSPQKPDPTQTLINQLTQQFLKEVNSQPQLKQDLQNYPMSAKNLEFEIFFRGRDGKYAKAPNIARAEMNRGAITLYEYSQNQFKIVRSGRVQ